MASEAGRPMPWSEAKQYISQVVAFLENSSTEAETLRQIKELRADISSVMMGRESDAKKIIAELVSRVHKTEGAGYEALPAIEEVRARVEALESRQQALLESLTKLKSQKDISSANLLSFTQQLSALKQATNALVAGHSETVPRVKHSLSLYANITSIRWDYDAPQGTLAGYVAPPDGRPVKPFSMDQRLMSPMTLADQLWETVASAHGM